MPSPTSTRILYHALPVSLSYASYTIPIHPTTMDAVSELPIGSQSEFQVHITMVCYVWLDTLVYTTDDLIHSLFYPVYACDCPVT